MQIPPWLLFSSRNLLLFAVPHRNALRLAAEATKEAVSAYDHENRDDDDAKHDSDIDKQLLEFGMHSVGELTLGRYFAHLEHYFI